MGNVKENRRTAMEADRIARQAHKAAENGNQSEAAPAEKSTADKAIHVASTALAVYGDVMGAYGKVMGATGALAEKAVIAVFSKLSFLQGLACLPASSQLDPVIGIDVHFVMIPPSPSPVPMPHPYIATVFDPKDWISCAVMSVKAMIPPPPPESEGAQLASAVGNMAFGMIMGKLGLGATVKLGGFTPRTISGVKNKTIPHFPMGASFAPLPILKNAGHAQFGSLFLLADGEPFTGMMHLNNDCWDVGIMQLMRKKASPEAQHLFMPTGFVMAIPSHNVIVNPIPTPINPIAALTKLLNFGIAKLLHKIIGKLPGGRISDALHKAVCHVTGHPVDVVSGMLFTDGEDFSLPGVIPFSWERTWYSDSIYKGPLGHGWYHNYDMAFAVDKKTNQAAFRMNDGRMVGFELPAPGKFSYDRKEKLFLHNDVTGDYYYIVDRDGLRYSFTDNAYGNDGRQAPYKLLRSVSNNNRYSLRFEYNSAGHLNKIIDSSSRVLTVENDADGRIINIIAPHPKEYGKVFTIAHYDYDELGNMVCHTDALGQQMKFEYEKHLLVRETWRNGMQWYFRYEGIANGSRCIHTWGDGDIYNHKLTYLDGCTNVENSLGHTTAYYYKNGLLYNKVDANGAEWGYRYNRFNELEWETDPLGNQQNYSHDDWGNIITSTDAGGGFTSTEYYNPQFPLLPTAAMDAAGGKWKMEYDKYGNVSVEIDPLGSKTAYVYKEGLLIRKIETDGAIVNLEYDEQQNLIYFQTDDAAVTHYAYDFLGNCTTIVNPNKIKQNRVYDLKCRTIEVNDFDNNNIKLKYDGIDNIVEYRDYQRTVYYTYKGLWNKTSRTEGGATIVFKYDTEEQLCRIINEHGSAYRFRLDAVGNVLEEIGFDNVSNSYQLNAAGWITKVLRPAGKFTKYQQDPCGRVTQVEYSDGKTETYVYRPDGELIQAINEFAKIEFERDAVGNVLKENINGEWVASVYDINNNRTSISSSLGANINLRYNKMRELDQISSNKWTALFDYDKLGLEVNRIMPGGVKSHWRRDSCGRPIGHRVENSQGRNITINRNQQYRWDVTDRLQAIKNEKGTIQFEHDAWSNLSITTFPNGEIQFRNPDAIGNVFKTIDRKDRVYASGGRLKRAGDWEYCYDEEGNLTEKVHLAGSKWKYEWNDANMLVKVLRPDNTAIEFTYDALGRRLSKIQGSIITNFIWNSNQLLHEWKRDTILGENLTELNLRGSDKITWLFDSDSFAPVAKIKGENEYSIVTDHIGTPVQMFQDDGAAVWECELDSFGKIRMETGEIGSCPFRYQGQYEDRETGLYYNRFRYYNADDGVYLSRDPIGLHSDEFNFYRYVDDPNLVVDEFGLAPYHRKNGQFGLKRGRPKKKSTHGNSVHSKRPTQHYVIHDSKNPPKTYHGVGDTKGKRAEQSLARLQRENKKEKFKIVQQNNHGSRKPALKAEDRGIKASGGPGSPGSYNEINSPGAKL